MIEPTAAYVLVTQRQQRTSRHAHHHRDLDAARAEDRGVRRRRRTRRA